MTLTILDFDFYLFNALQKNGGVMKTSVKMDVDSVDSVDGRRSTSTKWSTSVR